MHLPMDSIGLCGVVENSVGVRGGATPRLPDFFPIKGVNNGHVNLSFSKTKELA